MTLIHENKEIQSKKSSKILSRKVWISLISVLVCLLVLLYPVSVLYASSQISDFVDRAYQLILGREGESDGLTYWIQGLESNELDAAGMIYGFVNSEEFHNKNLSNEEQVEIMYNVMLNRTSDAEGKAAWVNIMDSGCSINAVLSGFTGSQEFSNLCKDYGIISGELNNLEARDKNPNITAFVSRAYDVLLGRQAEVAGLNGWCEQILDGSIVAANIVDSFMRSNEYGNFGRNSKETISDIYLAMLGRGADEPGLEHWVSVYNKGVSISYMIEQFTGSDEYKNMCEQFGIVSGHLELTENRDQNLGYTEFVNRNYLIAFGRPGDKAGLNEWTGKLLNREEHPINIVKSFLNSDECKAHDYSDESFVNVVYGIAFGRTAADTEMSSCLARLQVISRSEFIDETLAKEEFETFLSNFGLTPRFLPDKMVCLTFDDGPYSPVTNRILDALEYVGGHATFFIVGDRADTYSSCIMREQALGCEIANHTWSHPNNGLTSISYAEVVSQITQCNEKLHSLTGEWPSVMRPVGGSYNDTVASAVNMPMIIWSLDTADWKYRDTDHIIDAILNNVSDGDVILMHDLYPTTAAAVEQVIPELVRRGYALVTISEMAEYRGIDLEKGVAYYSLR